MEVIGSLTNQSEEAVDQVNVSCEVTNLFGVVDNHGTAYKNLNLKPGQTMSLNGRVTTVSYKPVATICRVSSVQKV